MMNSLLNMRALGLGVQNCCLAAHALGVSITLLSWARHTAADEIELRRILGIPEYCQIIVAGAAGYPRFATPAPHRKSVEETLTIVRRPPAGLRTGVKD
jgi:nitroreductase